MLRELADVLARALSKLSLKCHSNCKRFLRTGRKQGELQFPSFKKAKKEYPGNHKQVSLTLIPPEHKKTLFHYHEGGLVLQQLAQRLIESLSLEILNNWTQSALADPA